MEDLREVRKEKFSRLVGLKHRVRSINSQERIGNEKINLHLDEKRMRVKGETFLEVEWAI